MIKKGLIVVHDNYLKRIDFDEKNFESNRNVIFYESHERNYYKTKHNIQIPRKEHWYEFKNIYIKPNATSRDPIRSTGMNLKYIKPNTTSKYPVKSTGRSLKKNIYIEQNATSRYPIRSTGMNLKYLIYTKCNRSCFNSNS